MNRQGFIYLFLTVFIILFFALPAQAVRFVLSPPRFEFTMSHGSSTTEAIEISNKEDTTLELRAYLEDWDIDTRGEMTYKKAGSLKTSCSSWVKVNPQNITLRAQESRLVRFTVTTPPGTAGSYWTILFFESKEAPTAKGKMGVIFTGRVGVIIYTSVAGTELRSGKILDLKINKDKENNYKLAVNFENTGNIHYRPKGTWLLKNEAGKKINKGEIDEFVILPKVKRTKEVRLEERESEKTVPIKLPPGKYTLSVELDYGAKDLVGGDLSFEVP